MHARVAAFENRDRSRVDELVQIIRDRATGELPAPDALAMLMLVDRSAGTALGVSLFENEEAIRQAEPTFDRLGDEIPEELRGKRVSVDIFEVAIHEVSEDATAARVSTLSGPADAIDDAIRNAEETILPEARALDGWKGVIALVNRQMGTQKLFTLWENEAALKASEQAADSLRRRSAEHSGGSIVSVERYEIPLIRDRAPRLVAH
jgi:hypothetical protein